MGGPGPYGYQQHGGGQHFAYSAPGGQGGLPQPPRKPSPRRRAAWIGSGAVVLAVAIVSALLLALGPRGGSGSGAAQGSPSSAKPATGGPFMDSLQSQPVELWKVTGKELSGEQFSSFGYLLAGNADTALVSVITRKTLLVAVDSATGKKKWQAEVPDSGDCELSGDGHAVCWSTDLAGKKPKMGDRAKSTTWSFFAPDGSTKGNVVLSIPGNPSVRPLRDGFLVLLPGDEADDESTVVSFSSSGEQRWTTKEKAGVASSLQASEPAGLFAIDGTNQRQVHSLSDGRQVSDFSELTGGSASVPVQVGLYATGFSAATAGKTVFYDPQGKKTAGLDGWQSAGGLLGSSSSCGKAAATNQTGFSVVDPASGKVLWQQAFAEAGESDTAQFGCVSDYLLVKSARNASAIDIYELGSGKRTGSVPSDGKTVVVGSDKANLLVKKGDSSAQVYEAYSLSGGQRLWAISETDNSYAFCGQNHNGPPTRELVDGGLYQAHPLNSFARVGAKP